MSVADVVDEIFRLYRRNPALLFGVSAVIWLPASIALFVFQFVTFHDLPTLDNPRVTVTPAQLADSVAALLAALAIAFLVGVVAGPLLLGAITDAVSARYLGRPVTITSSVRRAFACYLRIIAAFVIVVLAATVSSLAIALVGSVAAAAVGGIAALALVFLAITGAIVAFVWIVTTWTLTGQAIVIENAGVFAALSRSRALVSGSRWRVLGLNSLLYLIQFVLFTVPSAAVALITTPLPSPLGPAISQVVTALAQIAYFPIQLGTLTLLYYDLRVRKEAFDLSLAAEQLTPA
jgi:hypothetical protein